MTEALTIQVSFDEKSLAAMAALTEAITNMSTAAATATSATAALADAVEETVEEKPAAKKTAAKKPAAKKPAPKPEPEEEPETTISREDVRAKLKEVGSAVDQKAALGILTKFGAKTMSALKEEDFEAAMEAAQELIDGAADGDALDS